jgi:hypothetical protein
MTHHSEILLYIDRKVPYIQVGLDGPLDIPVIHPVGGAARLYALSKEYV